MISVKHNNIRNDFPILDTTVYGQPLVYLDNAATTQKPRFVLDRIMDYYRRQNSNIHRGVHTLSEQASGLYEAARACVRAFINADCSEEIVFTGGATESINLAAACFGRAFLKPGDEVLITGMEHHSNIVPWQQLCQNMGVVLNVIPVDDHGSLLVESLDELITERTRLLAVTYVSNALGTINPVRAIIDSAHAHDVPVLVDAAQAIQHLPVDVQALDCDFLVFSGHKMYAETGVGVLYGKRKWLEAMPPYQCGGGMVRDVNYNQTRFAETPLKFEAGTGNIGGVLSLQAAIEYLTGIGFDFIGEHEHHLVTLASERIAALEGVRVYGPPARCGIVSFNVDRAHAYDVGMILDKLGIAVRTGHHCAQPLMDRLGINGTVRASFGIYNSPEEIDRLVAGIRKAQTMLCPKYA